MVYLPKMIIIYKQYGFRYMNLTLKQSIFKYIFLIAFNLILPAVNCLVSAEELLTDIDIPADKGAVTARWTAGGKSPLIVHIRDVHCNYSIQNNIADILEILVANYGIGMVAVEAASGDVDTSMFAVFPDSSAKENVCDKFMKNGVLTGAEKLSICKSNELPFFIWGVENPDSYRANLKSFRTAYMFSRRLNSHLQSLRDTLDLLKQYIYPPQLYDFQKHATDYHQAVITFENWAVYLEEQALTAEVDLDIYPNAEHLFLSMHLEHNELDYGLLALERQKLMTVLKQNVPADTFKNLMRLELQFNLGTISANDYYNQLSKYIDEYGLCFPNLQIFSKLALLKSSIDYTSLLTELDQLEETVKNRLIDGYAVQSKAGPRKFADICKSLESISETILVYERLVGLTLSDAEFLQYQSVRKSFSIDAITARISDIAGTYGLSLNRNITSSDFVSSFNRSLDLAEQFYEVANNRSEQMVSNLIDKMERNTLNKAVLVTGGFHSRAVENMLQSLGVSYVTITPASTTTDTRTYLDLMLSADLDQVAFQSVSAGYIGYPVLCNPNLADSQHFNRLRTQLARSLIEYKGIPVDVYRAQLPDDASRQLFNTLLIMAGLSVDAQTDIAVGRLVSDVSAQSMYEFLLACDNKVLSDELVRSGADPGKITIADAVLYAQYLLSFLELAVQVVESPKGYAEYLVDMIDATLSAELSAMHAAVYTALFKLQQNNRLTQKEIQIAAVRQSMQTNRSTLQELSHRIFSDMHKEGLIGLKDGLQPADIELDTTLVPSNFNPWTGMLQFKANVPLADGSQKSFFISSIDHSERYAAYNALIEKLGRKPYLHYASGQPYQAITKFQITEQVAPMMFYEVAADSKEYAKISGLLANALAQRYIFGASHVSSMDLRVVTDGIRPVAVLGEPFDMRALKAGAVDLSNLLSPFIRYIDTMLERGVEKHDINAAVESFLDSFIDELRALQNQYGDNPELFTDIPAGIESGIWNEVVTRLSADLFDVTAVRGQIEGYLDTEFQKISALEEELKSVASVVLGKAAEQGGISAPLEIDSQSIVIGKRHTAHLARHHLRMGIWFEAIVDTPQGKKSFFLKTVATHTELYQRDPERAAVAVLTALNRMPYSKYSSGIVAHPWRFFAGFRVSEKIGTYGLNEVDPFDNDIGEIVRLYGIAVAEALVIGLSDRQAVNLRVLLENDRPAHVLSIDYENVFSDYLPAGGLDRSLMFAVSFFTRLQNAGLDKARLKEISTQFVKGIEDGLREIIVYNNYTKPVVNPELAANPDWLKTLDRLKSIEKQLPDLISHAVDYINDRLNLSINDTKSQLQAIAYSLLTDAAGRGFVAVAEGFSMKDIQITAHNCDSNMVIDENNMRITVSIPRQDGSFQQFHIVVGDGADRISDALHLLKTLHGERFVSIYDDTASRQIAGFYASDSFSTVGAGTYQVTDDTLAPFSAVMGFAMAQAYIAGLPEQSYDNVMIELKNGQPVMAYNIGLEQAFSSQEDPVMHLKRFMDHLKYASGIESDQMIFAAQKFLGHYWWNMRFAQSMYEAGKSKLVEYEANIDSAKWNDALNLLDASKTDLSSVMEQCILYLNTTFSQKITINDIYATVLEDIETGIKNELIHYAYLVVRDMASAGKIGLPADFSEADVVIESHNVDEDMVVEHLLPVVCLVSFIRSDGSIGRIALKSQSPGKQNRSYLTLTALDLFGRPSYGYFFSQRALTGYIGTHVFDVVGDMNANEFLERTVPTETSAQSFSAMIGKLMAEAFIFGIPDRNLSNIRVKTDNGQPVALFNVDFDEALSPDVGLDNVIRIQFLRHLASKGLSTNGLRDAAQQFLENFYMEIVKIQAIYNEHQGILKNHPALAEYPDWNSLLERANPNETSAVELLNQALEILNLDLNYRFGFTLPVAVTEQIVSGKLVSDSRQEPAIDAVAATRMAYSVLKNLEQNGYITLHEFLTEAELELEIFDIHDRLYDGKTAIVMKAVVADAKGLRRSYIIKSDYPGNNTEAALKALNLLGRDTVNYWYSDISAEGFSGFHVLEEIGSFNASEFHLSESNWTEFAYLVGGAMAEAYAIGLHDRSYNNIRIEIKNGVPVSAYNIDFDSALNEQFNLDNIRYEVSVKFLLLPRLAGIEPDQVRQIITAFFKGFYVTYAQIQEHIKLHRKTIAGDPDLSNQGDWQRLIARIDPAYISAQDVVTELIRQVNDSGYARENSVNIDVADVLSAEGTPHDRIEPATASTEDSLDIHDDTQLVQLAYAIITDIAGKEKLSLPVGLRPEQITVTKRSLHLVDPYTFEHKLWFVLTIPDEAGNLKEYIVRSFETNSNVRAGVEALTAVNRKPFGYYATALHRYGFDGFDLIESVGQMSADEFDLRSALRDSFAYQIGKATALAYVFSINDRHLGNIRLVLDNGLPVDAVNIDLDTALTRSYGYSFEFTDLLRTELLERAKKARLDKDMIRQMLVEYFKGFATELTDLHSYYAEHAGELQNHPTLREFEEWKNVLNRMDSAKLPVLLFIKRVITDLNSSLFESVFGFVIEPDEVMPQLAFLPSSRIQPNNEAQLRNIAYQVITDIAEKGNLALPEQFAIADIRILNHNYHSEDDLLAGKSLWIEVAVPMADGSEKSFHIKSHNIDNNSQLAVAALHAMGRQHYAYYFSDEYLYNLSGFHLSEMIGDADVKDYVPSSAFTIEYAVLLGRAMAEAYAVSLPDRNPHNLRVVLKDAKPLQVVNIDLDWALQGEPEQFNVYMLGYLRMIGNLASIGFRDILTAYLQGFLSEYKSISDYYSVHYQQLQDNEILRGLPVWQECLDRIDPKKTSLNSIILEIIEKINRVYFEDLYGRPLTLGDVFNTRFNIVKPDFARDLSGRHDDKETTVDQLQSMAYSLLRDIQARNLMSVSRSLNKSDIKVIEHSIGSEQTLEQASSISMTVSFPDDYGKIVSVRIESDTGYLPAGYTLYNAMGRFPPDYYQFVNLEAYGKKGFHVMARVSGVDADVFTADSPVINTLARFFGSVMAEAYVTGNNTVTLKDMKVVLDRGNPVKAVNTNLAIYIHPDFEIESVYTIFQDNFLQQTVEYGRSALQARMLIVSYLDGFISAFRDIQNNYRTHKKQLEEHPQLSKLPFWETSISRMDETKTPSRSLAESLIKYFNDSQFLRDYGISLAANEILPLPSGNRQILSSDDPAVDAHILEQLRHLVYKIAGQLAQDNAIYLPSSFAPSDIYIEEHNLDDRFVQAHPEYMNIMASIPMRNGNDVAFIITPAPLGRNKTADVNEILKAMGRAMYEYYQVDIDVGQIGRFHVNEEISVWGADELNWGGRYNMEFVEKLARPMAEAYVLGLPGRYPANMRVALDDDRFPDYVFNRGFDEAFSYDLPLASIVRFDFLKQAKLSNVGDEDLHAMAHVFIKSFKDMMYEMQDYYASNKDLLRTDTSILAVPEHEQFFARLDENSTSVPHVMLDLVTALNDFLRREGFAFTVDPLAVVSVRELTDTDIDDPTGEIVMRDFAVKVFNFISEFSPAIPKALTTDDVKIGIRSSYIGPGGIEEYNGPHIWFEAKFNLSDGSEKSYFIKTIDDESMSSAGVLALRAFERKTFDVFSVNMEFGKFNDFAVLESVGDISANEFNIKSEHIERFAIVTGKAMGEAYMFGFSDRHFGNIRLRMDGDMPVEAVNIDFDDAFDEFFSLDDIAHHMYTELIAPAKRFGVSDEKIRSVLVSFLRGVYDACGEIQARYSEKPEFFQKLDKLAFYPQWYEMLDRMDSQKTPLASILEDIVTIINESEPTDKYQFGLNVAEIIAPLNQQQQKPVAKVDLADEIHELAYRIVTELTQDGRIGVDKDFSISDIVIENKQIGNMIQGGIEDRILFEFSFTDSNGKRNTLIAKSIRYGDFEYLGSTALHAMKRPTFNFFESRQFFKYYSGFYIMEKVGDISIGEYTPESVASARLAAEYAGEAVAEACLLGLPDRNSENIRLVLLEGRPVKAINIDLTNAVLPSAIYPDYLISGFVAFMNNRIQDGYNEAQITSLIHSFLTGFWGGVMDIQEYYIAHKQELASHPKLEGYPRWQSALKRLDPETTNISNIQRQIIELLNTKFGQSIISRAALTQLAVDCAQELKRQGYLPEGIDVSDRTVSTGIDNIDSLNVMSGEIPLWFELFVTGADGQIYSYFLKAQMSSHDESILVLEALNALGRFPYAVVTTQRPAGAFKRFLATERIGDMDADEFEITPQNAFIFAQRLGIAFAEAYTLGLQDRLLKNMRVVLRDNMPEKIVNIDFEDGFGRHEESEDFFLPVIRLFSSLSMLSLDEDGRERMAVGFLNGFAYGIAQLQSVFEANRHQLVNHPVLSINPQWQSVLEHLDASAYPLGIALLDVWNYIRSTTDIDAGDYLRKIAQPKGGSISATLSEKLIDETQLDTPDVQVTLTGQALNLFIESQGFVSFQSGDTAVEMEVAINNDQTLFLKKWKSLRKRVTDRIRRFYTQPATAFNTNMRFMLYTFFSTSGVELAANRLGGLVPPMIRGFRAPDGTVSVHKVEGYDEFFIQQRQPYIVREIFETCKQTADTQTANALIDSYFAMVQEMWRRGVFDTDLAMWKNHGVAESGSNDIRLFDLSALTDNRAAALHVLLFKPHFKRILGKLSDMLPQESMDYFIRRHGEVFTTANFGALWNTGTPVAVPQIDLTLRQHTGQLTDYSEQRAVIRDFLSRFGFEGRRDMEESLISLFIICNQDDPAENIEAIVGYPISAQTMKSALAVRDSNLMREINAMTFSLVRTTPDYLYAGLLQLAIYEYMSTAFDAPATPVDLDMNLRMISVYEESI